MNHLLLQADSLSARALLEPLSVHKHTIATRSGVGRSRKLQLLSRETSQVASSSILAFTILSLFREMQHQRILEWPPQQSRAGLLSGITVERDHHANCTMRISPNKTRVCMRGILHLPTASRIPVRRRPLAELRGVVSLHLPDGRDPPERRCMCRKTTT